MNASLPICKTITVPVLLSGAHIHLSDGVRDTLYPRGLTHKRELNVEGCFVCVERALISGHNGKVLSVAIIDTPRIERTETQLEMSPEQFRDLDMRISMRASGDLADTDWFHLVYPGTARKFRVSRGAIVNDYHIHIPRGWWPGVETLKAIVKVWSGVNMHLEVPIKRGNMRNDELEIHWDKGIGKRLFSDALSAIVEIPKCTIQEQAVMSFAE
jgi:propanediol utilization protein